MIRAIVFDFGNVVGHFDHRLVTERLAPHSECDPDAFHAFIFGGELEHAYESGTMTSDEFIQVVHEKGRLRCGSDFVRSAYADIFWPNPDVAAFLPRLKPHYRLILASNTSELHSQQFRRQFAETLAHFDALVLSHKIGARKPSAAFYEHCRRLADVPADQCVFIDDLPANVDGARACGWNGIVYAGISDLETRLAALGVKPSAATT